MKPNTDTSADNSENTQSPRFKHKKYLKSKFEEELATLPETSGTGKPKSVVVQPPLPPNPPPDELPPIVLKKEIEDEYRNDNSDFNQSQFTRDDSNKTDNTQKVMCRDFIRGSCIKGESCIYLHKLIISQLEGVFTFCRDFQNKKGCKMPNGKICKFVHANVFEKENFFKTGYLPPHTMSHFKDINVSQPAPQLPPEERTASVSAFQPLPVLHPVVTQGPVVSGARTSSIAARTDVFKSAMPASTLPQKREWNDSDDFKSSSPRDFDTSEPLAKKCKHCDINTFRFQCNKDKVTRMKCNSEKFNHEIALLTKKSNNLYNILLAMLKAKPSSGTGMNSVIPSWNINADKEKIIREHLNLFQSPNSRLSLINEDKERLMRSQISTLLAKHILRSGDPTLLSPDGS